MFFFSQYFFRHYDILFKVCKTGRMSFSTEESFEVDSLLRERTIRVHSLSLNVLVFVHLTIC